MNATATAPRTAEIPNATMRRQPWKLLNNSNPMGATTWAAAREAAGLTWEPTAQKVLVTNDMGEPILDGLDNHGRPVYRYEEDYKKVTRGPGGATLGIVRDGYGVIGHDALGRLIDPVLDVPGTQFEHLVELNGGQRIFGIVKIGDEKVLPGDFSPTIPYLCFTTTHDAMGALRVWGSATRLSCTNQMNASEAIGRKNGMHAVIRHTALWELRSERVHELVATARNQFGMLSSIFDELSHMPITAANREAFVRAYFPMPTGTKATDSAIRACERKRDTLRALYESDTNAPLMGTALGLAQAAGEWADWIRSSKTPDSLLDRNVIKTDVAKLRAWKLARNVMTLAA